MLRKSFTYRPWCQQPSSYTCDIYIYDKFGFLKKRICFYIVIFTSKKHFLLYILRKPIVINTYIETNKNEIFIHNPVLTRF